MSGIDPKLNFLRPGLAAPQPEAAPETNEAAPAPEVDARLDLATPDRPQRRPLNLPPTAQMVRIGLFSAAGIALAAQIATTLAAAPPPAGQGVAVTSPHAAASQIIRVSAEARRAISAEPLTWRALFDHYDLPDTARTASMRQTLGNLSAADLDAATDAVIPADADVEIVLRN